MENKQSDKISNSRKEFLNIFPESTYINIGDNTQINNNQKEKSSTEKFLKSLLMIVFTPIFLIVYPVYYLIAKKTNNENIQPLDNIKISDKNGRTINWNIKKITKKKIINENKNNDKKIDNKILNNLHKIKIINIHK